MATLKQLIASHLRAKAKYETSIAKIQAFVQDRCDFEIYMNDFAGDGLSVMSEDNACGIRIDDAAAILKFEKRITEANFRSYL